VSSSYIKKIITLSSGNTIAQLIPLLMAPILTRIYTVNDFAMFTLFISVCSIIGVFSNLKYSSAIVIAASKKEASLLVDLCFYLILLTGIAICIFLLLEPFGIKELLGQHITSNWLLIPLFVVFAGFNELVGFVLTRENSFKMLSFIAVVRSVLMAICNILFYSYFVNNLIVSQVIAFSVSLVFIFYYKLVRGGERFDFTTLSSTAYQYRDFPRNKLPQNLFDIINTNGVIFIISYYFGGAELGLYALLFRVMLTPVKLIGAAIGQVVYSELANLVCHSYKRIRNTIVTVITVTAAPYVFIYFYGGEFFSFIFGDDWYKAGVYAGILSPYFLLYLPASILSFVPTAFRLLKQGFYISLSGNALSLTIYFFAGVFYDIKVALYIVSIVLTSYYMMTILWYLYVIKKESLKLSMEVK
jgi:O-antigen/teichoic acid export membrane protein